MHINAPDQLSRTVQNQTVRRRLDGNNIVAPEAVGNDKKQQNMQYTGDRRRQRDRRQKSMILAKDRRTGDRRSLHTRTPKRIRTLISNSDNPAAPGGNHNQGKIINEKV